MSRAPTLEWQVAGACNYACSYCIQSPKHRRGGLDPAGAEAVVRLLEGLVGEWEVKCSGGEAFAHPAFLDVVIPALAQRTRCRVSVLTNFSASDEALARFVGHTRGRLAVFSASLHLEWVTLDEFAAKAERFVRTLDADTRFVVNQVVRPGHEDEAERCRDRLAGAGIRWFPQLLKVGGGLAAYPDPARLRRLIGEAPGPRAANVAPSYRGRRCWAGVDYAVIDKDGDVWSCRTAKRHGDGYLGNVFRGDVQLRDAPRPCAWDICPCTVPANRGMIEGVGADGGGEA